MRSRSGLPWPSDLQAVTGVDVALQQAGGFEICFTDADMRARAALLARVVGDVPYEMLDHAALKARLPAIGPKVAGASYCPLDGHVNPLKLLHALHAGLKAQGARILSSVDIAQVGHREESADFEVASRDGQTWRAPRVVLAAGLGNKELAPQVGLQAPVSPTRGQILITERLQPFLPYPANLARQTNEGSVQLGATVEAAGLDEGTTVAGIESIARRAVTAFPVLSNVRMVRAWSGLRVLTPDSLPIYQESPTCPGAFVATTHSGVSLAGVHAQVIGPWMAGLGPAPDDIDEFSGARFQDPTRSFSNAFLDAFSHGR